MTKMVLKNATWTERAKLIYYGVIKMNPQEAAANVAVPILNRLGLRVSLCVSA